MSRVIRTEPLTSERFERYGDVLVPPSSAGRNFFEASLRNDRLDVGASLSLSRVEAAESFPLKALRMERHEKSSQSFVPLGPVRFLVLVAPHAAEGGPNMGEARAFLAQGGVGVTYGADVWHHPLSVFQAPAGFAVFMWRDGGPEDEEFVDIEPLTVLPMEDI
ncbi:ureidoglycolate hydrolase [Pikeienuella piscinae]|uniref:Ureidoglycolate hydrolase n=1 Tax=Pikeienuella piscinae TaxID=2748098 RepID=A0A7L5BW48_9RHOB|nr:ureidoglycolate lyase [Pikeienuella piscinae]QIE56630.1 ureidoglycolate hydrolase [Pikeienuella piscinae]